MSGSVDNQFAGLVAYDQHGPGYPALDAGQEATQGVAAQINAGQVNADNGITSNGIAGQGINGQGDSGAAAAPAPVGQAAKDPLRRPDDAKPFQCVSEMPLSICSQHINTAAGYHCRRYAQD